MTSKHAFYTATLVAIVGAQPAYAKAAVTSENSKSTKVVVTSEYTNYSGTFGNRVETTAESINDLGNTTLVFGASQGRREIGDDKFNALRFSGTIYRDWSDRFYTRTSISASSNKPVFATREISQDLNYKPLANTVLTVGGKYAKYFGGNEALSWSAGGSYYFNGGFVTYRFSQFDVSKLGKSHGHSLSVRFKEGKGQAYTQLWLGTGTSLHDQQVLPAAANGKYRTVMLQRLQPVKGPIALSFGLGRSWYETGTSNYHGTTATVGLTVTGWPKL